MPDTADTPSTILCGAPSVGSLNWLKSTDEMLAALNAVNKSVLMGLQRSEGTPFQHIFLKLTGSNIFLSQLRPSTF